MPHSFDYCVKEGLKPEAEELRGAYEVAARSLISANATLAAPCLRSLAKALQGVAYAAANGPRPQYSRMVPPTDDVLSEEATTSENDVPMSKAEISAASLAARVVGMVVGVVGAVPTAGATLIGCYFAEYFPHRFRDERCLAVYARAVLEVARRLPRLSGDLVALLVDRCLEIDVEIKLDEFGNAKLTGAAAAASGTSGGSDSEGDAEEEEEDPMLLGFGASLGNRKAATPSGAARPPHAAVSSDSTPAAAAALLTAPLAVDDMASKLDGLMLELFKHLDHVLLPKEPSTDQTNGDNDVHHSVPAPTGSGASRSNSAPDLTRAHQTSGNSSSHLTPSMSSPALRAALDPPASTVSSSQVAWGADHDASLFASVPNHPHLLEDGSPRSPVGYPSSSLSPTRHQPPYSSPQDNDTSLRLWQALHGAFEAQVLLTHRSKFVQFLLLRFVHLAPQHGPTFAARLLNTATDKRVPHVRRVNAVRGSS